MADERDEGKRGRWRQEARGKGEARRALQAKSIRRVGGAANSITCSVSTHTGSRRARREAGSRSEVVFCRSRGSFPRPTHILPLQNHLAPKLSSEISSSNTIRPWKCLGNLASIELTIQRDCQPLGMPN